MSGFEDYALAWVIYLVAAVGLYCVLSRMTRRAPKSVRKTARTLGAVLLFTPVPSPRMGDTLWLVPAYLQGAYEGILGNQDDALQAVLWLSVALLLVTLLQMLESTLRRLLA